MKYTFAYNDNEEVNTARKNYLHSITSDRIALQSLIDAYPDVGLIPDPEQFRITYDPEVVTNNNGQISAVSTPQLPDGTQYKWQWRSKKFKYAWVEDEKHRLGYRTNILRDVAGLAGNADIRVAFKVPLSGWNFGPWIEVQE